MKNTTAVSKAQTGDGLPYLMYLAVPQYYAPAREQSRHHDSSAVNQRLLSDPGFASGTLWLIDLAGILYAVSMHKFAVRNPLATGAGIQGIIEAGGMTGAFLCVLIATRRYHRQYAPSIVTICFATFGVFALGSSWRSFNPLASTVKGMLFLIVLATCYLACQTGLAQRYFRSIYRSYVGLLVLGLIAGVLLPHMYPLFSIDEYSGRTTMSVFNTFFGVTGEDTVLMLLLAPLIFERPAWTSGFLLFGMNVMAGGKTSTGLICVLLIVRFLSGVHQWRSWRAVGLVVGVTCLTALAVLSSFGLGLTGSFFDKPAEAIYGNQVNTEAGGLDGRVGLWMGAINLLPDVPLLGYGFEGDRERMIEVASWSGSAHNSFLEMTLSGGVAGFMFLLSGLVLVGRACIQAPSEKRLHLFSVLAFILVDAITGGIFDNPSFIGLFTILWLSYQAETKTTEYMPQLAW